MKAFFILLFLCFFNLSFSSGIQDSIVHQILPRDSVNLNLKNVVFNYGTIIDFYGINNIHINNVKSPSFIDLKGKSINGEILIEKLNTRGLIISSDGGGFSLNQGVSIYNSKFAQGLSFIHCSFVKPFIIAGSRFENCNLQFQRDSFQNGFELHYDRGCDPSINIDFKNLPYDTITEICFTNCYLNGELNWGDNGHVNLKEITFHSCSFGPSFVIRHPIIPPKFIIFENCRDVGSEIDLNFSKYFFNMTTGKMDSFPFHLNFINTDVTKIKFKYDELGKVEFLHYPDNPDADTKDMQDRTFKDLLDKFTKEGSSESYKNTDIDFKKLKYLRYGLLGRTLNWFHYNLSNYGYDPIKPLVIFKNIFLIFFTVNCFFWQGMSNACNLDNKIILKSIRIYYPSTMFIRNHRLKTLTFVLQALWLNLYRYFIPVNFGKSLVLVVENLLKVLAYTCVNWFSITLAKRNLNFDYLFFAWCYLIQFFLGSFSIYYIINYLIKS